MRTNDWLTTATRQLTEAGIPTARLDCLVLLEDKTKTDRAWLLAHPEHNLKQSDIKSLKSKITKRARHVPLAYILGKSEFYGRQFIVTPYTLVPRPETETMIDLLKTLFLPAGSRVLDIGTGSGCIAITAALELQDMEVSGCDIDTHCLSVATKNAEALAADVEFFTSDLFEQAMEPDVVLANLPYVPDNFQINTAATHEPRHAIFGGKDGLDLYRTLFKQLDARSVKPQYILTESLPPQHEALAEIAAANGYAVQRTDDFIQLFKLS